MTDFTLNKRSLSCIWCLHIYGVIYLLLCGGVFTAAQVEWVLDCAFCVLFSFVFLFNLQVLHMYMQLQL